MDPILSISYSRFVPVPSTPLAADLAAVLETALDAVVIMAEDGRIVGWNKIAETSFGWSCAEVLGRHMRDLIIPPRFREAHDRGLVRFLETGDGPVLNHHIEITALDRDGREFPVELSITPTSSAGTRVFLGFLRDITERQRVSVKWSRDEGQDDGRAHLVWTEDGLSDVEAPRHVGFGTKMILASARHELKGETRLNWRPQGLQFDLAFPVEGDEA